MMMNRRLINEVGESKKYIAGNVAAQWVSLIANIGMMAAVVSLIGGLYNGEAQAGDIRKTGIVILAAVLIRAGAAVVSSRMSYLSSRSIKKLLREKIYRKLLRLGASYKEKIQTSEIVQVAVEGVDQLETYFGSYLPQFFYAMLAPLTLFAVICFINVPAAVVLLICVPLIPAAIAAVQTWAKKLLSKYWNQYTALGDTFLENLQGLTTLKIYQADGFKAQKMAEESEKFRKITMKVLSMQLNSITIMDLIAYGGAALGMIVAITQMKEGKLGLEGCLLIILLSADFFIPMRMLGSFFHIAMNGMAASDKIFRLLDMEEEGKQEQRQVQTACQEKAQPEIQEKVQSERQKKAHQECQENTQPEDHTIRCREVHFSYHTGRLTPCDENSEDREILKGISLELPQGSFVSIVGESGCGKSTIASVLMGYNRCYEGEITLGGRELRTVAEQELFRSITYVSHQSYLFKGTVRDNLLMGKPDATQEQLCQVLEKVKLADFLRSEAGLDTRLQERAANLSGGQYQRLALARALLHDTPIYIFDEATSNIDVESENDIMEQIHILARTKTVLLISHRLANTEKSDRIYVMEDGCITEQGSHEELLKKNGNYARLWNAQQELEHYGEERNCRGKEARCGKAQNDQMGETSCGKEEIA